MLDGNDGLEGNTPRWLIPRLSVMMFLQYFVQGCYLPIVSVYLEDAHGFTRQQVGAFGSALAVGPLFAPFIVGQIVDRSAATQHVLAFCHVLGGGVMLLLYWQSEFWPIVMLGTLYSLLYVPSMMLTNSLSFHHLPDSARQFPLARLWGTVGFIVPAWLIELVFLRNLEGDVLNQRRGIALAVAGIAGLAMGVYCLTLPHTPPPQGRSKKFAPLAAIELLRRRDILVLVVVSFVVAIVHQFYFVLNGPFLTDVLRAGNVYGAWEGRISSLGQIAEIGVMAMLGAMVVRLGFKRTMLIGLLAYALRCLIFAFALRLNASFAPTITLISAGQMLHGFCFGCFMAAAYMYLDSTTPKDLRGSVQSLYGTLVLGVGFLAGGMVSGLIAGAFTEGSGDQAISDWTSIWLSAGAIAALTLVAFAVWFPQKAEASPGDSGKSAQAGSA